MIHNHPSCSVRSARVYCLLFWIGSNIVVGMEELLTREVGSIIQESSDDCPCVDWTEYFSDVSNCGEEVNSSSLFSNNNDGTAIAKKTYSGFFSYVANTCLPVDYGSKGCRTYDLFHDPNCQKKNNDDDVLPDYCHEAWCWVDKSKCVQSEHGISHSELPFTLRDDIYYSYSTCNATNYWSGFRSTEQVKDAHILTTVPAIWAPAHYKVDSDGTIPSSQSVAYFNNSIPWQGWVLEYLDAVLSVSTIGSLEYVSRSKASTRAITTSIYTASIYDVQARISCLAAGLFWITADRLTMTSFTTPMGIDRITLWIPNPATSEKFLGNLLKVLLPFEPLLWFCLLLCNIVIAALSIWFATSNGSRHRWWKRLQRNDWKEGTKSQRFKIGCRMYLESFLSTMFFAFGNSVEYDMTGGLPINILNFGFALLTLIAIAAYTANLAAFLTISNIGDYVGTMEKAQRKGIPLCAHPAIRSDLERTWPDANFVFNTDSGLDLYRQMIAAYDDGQCEGLVAGIFDIRHDEELSKLLCDRNFINTDSLAVEKLLALPVCPEYSAGISHWFAEAENQQITYDSFEEKNRVTEQCSFDLNLEDTDNELEALTPANFALPFLSLIASILISTFLHLRKDKYGRGIKSISDGSGESTDDDRDHITSKADDELHLKEEDKNDSEERLSEVSLGESSDVASFSQDDLTRIKVTSDDDEVVNTIRRLQRYQNKLMEEMVESKKEI